MRRKKAFLLLLLILSAVFPLSGCLSPIQLNRQAIVQGIGIDYQDGKYRLTFQVFSPPDAAGGSNIGAPADNAKIICSEGATVSDAVQNGVRVQGKELFIGQNRVIVLGMGAAQHDLEESIAYFGTNVASRQNAHILVSATTAEEIISMKINQGILPAETLERITENARMNGLAHSVRLFELRKTLDTQHESAVLPVISVKEEAAQTASDGQAGESGGSQSIDQVSPFEIGETAVFSQNVFRGLLDKQQTRGMMWIRGEVESTSIQIQLKGNPASLHIYRAGSKLIPCEGSQKPEFNLSIMCHATKEERSAAYDLYSNEEELLLALENAAEQNIRSECDAAFADGAQALVCDFLNFGNILWQKNPSLFYTLQDNWDTALSDFILNVDVTVQIDRVGVEYGSGE